MSLNSTKDLKILLFEKEFLLYRFMALDNKEVWWPYGNTPV
jgi:hypothetical protein